MAAIDFPNAPTLNQEFTVGDRTWTWIMPEPEPTETVEEKKCLSYTTQIALANRLTMLK